MAARNQTHGARALGDERERKRRPGWLIPLLALLALLIIAAILIAALSGGDDKKSTSSTGGSAAAQLVAGGKSLLPASGERLTGLIGQRATGKGVVVQKLDGQKGFWVGPSATNRVYVEYGGAAGATESGAAYKPKVGQKVELAGVIRQAPRTPDPLTLTGADAKMLRQQGAYINADSVAAAK